MKKFDVIILGAGASGTFCALTSNQKNICIIDTNTKPAKKLLVTGNGRCNITNNNMSSNFFNTDISPYLNRYSVNQTLDYFKSIGLLTYHDDMGRVYPITNSAKSVMDVINNKLLTKTQVFMSQNILDITKSNDTFIIKTNSDEFECKKLVIATGGKSDNILDMLHIEYSPYYPSLVALQSNTNNNLTNIKVSGVTVTATTKLGKSMSATGEILFRENALSGIVIFDISTLFARNNNFEGQVSIDLLPNYSVSELECIIAERKKLGGTISNIFVGMFVNAITDTILAKAKINPNNKADTLTCIDISNIVSVIKNLQFDVKGYENNNQVYSGGVELSSLTQNLESKLMPNLYFCGEVINVDGICGGYNLQWAWTSGHIVGEAL